MLHAAGKIFPFHTQEEQIRVGRNQIEKRHFKFTYTSPISGKDIYILLDVVFEDNPYINIIDKAGFRYVNLLTAASSKKYNALKPNMAKMLLVYTINR